MRRAAAQAKRSVDGGWIYQKWFCGQAEDVA